MMTAAAALLLTSVAAQAQIKIGAVLSVTGGASFLGDPEKKTLEMYVADINAKGGIAGKKIELVIYDDASDPNQARTFATRLIEQDKVDALLAGSTTASTMAIIPLAEEAQTPLINFAGAVQAVSPVKKWNFKTPHTDLMACEKIFEDMKKRGTTKIAIIGGADAFGKSMRDQCMSVTGKYGIEVLHEETYQPRDNDMTPQLTNIKSKQGVQAVINPGFGQGPAIVTRNYKQLGIAVPLYQSHGVASKAVHRACDAGCGRRRASAGRRIVDRGQAARQRSAEEGRHRIQEDLRGQDRTTGLDIRRHMYDGLMIMVEAMQRAGGADKAKVRDEIEKTKNFVGTGGVVNMSATDHLGLDLTAFRMLEIKGGDWALVN
jgi:branched-chain amino acid transport system substrate-binding protein